MNTPNQLDQALEALRQEHRSIQPPPALEASILRQAEIATPRHTHTLRNWSLAFTTAAALAIAIALLYPRPSHPTVIETHATTPPSPQTTQAPTTVIATNPPAPTHQLASPRPHVTRTHRDSTKPTPQPFVLLPTGVGLPEPTQAMLVRTRIDTNSLRTYGLAPPPPGAPQTVLAEFLVGEDGLPRAIRLVP